MSSNYNLTTLPKVKICGLTTEAAVEAAVEEGVSYIGFVFFSASPRNISPKKAALLSKNIPEHIKKIAVLVDPDDKLLRKITEYFIPDYLQLHGDETPTRILEIKDNFGIPVIKAIKVRSADDVAMGIGYSNLADMILFDACAPESVIPGGNGLTFDWNLLKNRNFQIPWILSGGLNPDNVKEALNKTGAYMVDVSSGVEISPGKKDPELIRNFMQAILGG